MDVLATLVGCFTAVVPIIVISGAAATLDYRVSGTRRDDALHHAWLGLALSVGWGVALAALIAVAQWDRAALPPAPILALTGLPVVIGLLPSGLLLLLATGPSAGTPDQRPTWRTWVEAYS